MNWNKDRVTLYAIRALGVLAAVIFLTAKSPYLVNHLISDCFYDRGEYYGDQYSGVKVLRFKFPMPEPNGKGIFSKSSEVDSYQIIVIGDSFFNRCRGHDTLPYLLSQRLGEPVFYDREKYYNPFDLLRNASSSHKRILILECAERLILDRFLPTPDLNPEPALSPSGPLKRVAEGIRDRWFVKAEVNYRYFLNHCVFTSTIMEWWNSFNFECFGRISDSARVYSLQPPMLFLDHETDRSPFSFYYPHTDELISTLAGNLELIRDELKRRYNTELIFMPIPNKYTIEHRLVNNDVYDMFLPRLCAELTRRNVKNVPLYEKFIHMKHELYFPTDIHWNGKGLSIALDELLNIIKEVKPSSPSAKAAADKRS